MPVPSALVPLHRSPVQRLVLPALLAAAALHAAAAGAAELTVVVTNLKAPGGSVRVGLFKDAGTFPRPDRVLAGKAAPAVPGSVTVVFTDLAPGEYAVSAYHDLDDNGQLDRNFFGVPSEPHGFSRDARGFGGPPEFGSARITLPAAGLRISFAVK